MPGASTQPALGLVVAVLALVALAAGRPNSVTGASLLRPEPLASASVRALRDGQRLDLNQAQAADLILLPGVGPKLAERIVAARQVRGGFRSVEDLLDVRGIGPTTFARLARFVHVEPQRSKSIDAVSAKVK